MNLIEAWKLANAGQYVRRKIGSLHYYAVRKIEIEQASYQRNDYPPNAIMTIEWEE